MSYPIANVVYGIPLTEEICNIVIPDAPGFELDSEIGNSVWDVDDLLWGEIELFGFGFTSLYSASPDMDKTTGYLGVELWSDAYWDLTAEKFSLQPTKDQISEVKAKLLLLPSWFKEHLPEPKVCLVWSDS